MKKPAVFLDRDGVLCAEKGYITHPGQLEIFPYTRKCIERFKQAGFYTVCITNQSAVGRKLMTERDLRLIHSKLMEAAGLDKIYVCPHAPAAGCLCRKPGTGLIDQAAKDLKIDMSRSIMVGDRASDIICGRRAGLRTVLLESGYGTANLEQPAEPDYIFENLDEFCRKLFPI